MKITNLKINNFGNLENKEISFSDNINIIYGVNESGKSTLLKFIVGMFYGLSKNKNNKIISDFERYSPWNEKEFSGKLKYNLDNLKKYEIFRDFSKKNPKLLDETLNDVTKEYSIDKTKGSQFFYEQVKMDKELFTSTIVSEQAEVKLDEKEQNTLLQKIANLMGTGEDNTSFSKIINKLNKNLLEEVGTLKSQDRPINIIERKIKELTNKKNELMKYTEEKYLIEETKQEEEQKVQEYEKKISFLKELKNVIENKDLELEKIKIGNEVEKEYNFKINKLEEELKNCEFKKEKKESKRIITLVLFVLSAILGVTGIILKNNILLYAGLITVAIDIIYSAIIFRNSTAQNKKEITKVIKAKKEIEEEIKLLQSIKKDKLSELSKKEKDVCSDFNNKLEEIIKKYNEVNSLNEFDYEILKKQIENIQSNLDESKLNLHRIELDKKSILPQLDNLAQIDEQLKDSKDEYEVLQEKSKVINLTIEELKKADIEMKKNVTPKFTEKLSENIKNISAGKYKNVKLNNEKGLIVEIENGEYISAEKLSIGTIDQLYLSLRLATCEEISSEKMPIILDEVFAYYDSNRLENILKYLNEQFSDRQIIIFTCTKREQEILDKNSIEYSLISI